MSTERETAGATPRLDALLARLRARLLRLVWLHGAGSVAAVAALWLLFAFLADWMLHVPAPVRLFHTLVLVLLPLIVLQRELLRRLARVPDRAGLAILVERRHPRLAELFVTAVQLGPRLAALPAGTRELLRRVLARAEEEAGRCELDPVLDARGPRRRLAAGAGAALLAAGVLLALPQLASIFFQRMLGAPVPWPQRTHLALSIPGMSERAQIEQQGGEIQVRMARGSDLPLLVEISGEVPEELTLHFSSGRTQVLPTGGGRSARTRLRSVQEDLAFWVTGGDDRDGEPRVRVVVLQPPDVAGLAVAVTPPAYSGLEPSISWDRDVEVLAGSQLRVHVLTDPPDATGFARLLPEDLTLELTGAPFPQRAAAAATEGAPPPEPVEGLSFELEATESLRYRFELIDATGLPNPDPGLYGIQVLEDRRPEILTLSPGRAEVDVVPGGALALSARVEDDYGIAAIFWRVRRDSPEAQDGPPAAEGELERRPLPAEASQASAGAGASPAFGRARARARSVEIARTRLEVDALGGAGGVVEGTQLVLQLRALDNREPSAGESQSAPIRLRVVGRDEFLRRLQDRLARAGEQASRLADLQEEKIRRTREVLTSLSGDELEAPAGSDLGALVSGQRRVQGDARALSRELSAIAESLLYARVDERAGPLLESLDRRSRDDTERSFRPETWTGLARDYRAGSLGSAELAGQLVEIVGIALAVSEELATAAADHLSEARERSGPTGVRESLDAAHAAQLRAKERIDELLGELAEWDNYQSILSLTRDILNGQESLLERVRNFAKDQ